MSLKPREVASFEVEKMEELRATLQMISNWMVLPLYFLFWICDLIYVPNYKWEFLGLRALVIPARLVVQLLSGRVKSFIQAEWLALFFIFILGSVINAMIYLLGDPNTLYYAGLNLVAIGSLTFIPWSRSFFALANIAIFGPYFALIATHIRSIDATAIPPTVHTFFIVGTIVITFVIRHFHERLRLRDFNSRLQLADEIGNRDSVIIQKTEEALRMASLTSQFSPQVVEGIRSKRIDLTTKVHRGQICTIFIDIVNSTERVARVDKDKVHNVISRFMDDSIKILLKYDITIDKFLGDGILAFSNDPIPQTDFVDRVLFAAFEIRSTIEASQEFYENNWLSPLHIKIGIAVGYANVGFYGSERYFKSYTAIGPVVNLANRLCSVAEPNKIVISNDVVELIKEPGFKLNPLGKLKLKGFESDVIKGFEVEAANGFAGLAAGTTNDCPKCATGILQLTTDERGIYVLRCRNCSYTADVLPAGRNNKAA